MSKTQKSVAARQSPKSLIAITWLGVVAGLYLLWLATTAAASDLAGFRSCASNNTGLVVNTCGKASLNSGDIFILTMFVLAGCLVASLITAGTRMVRRPS